MVAALAADTLPSMLTIAQQLTIAIEHSGMTRQQVAEAMGWRSPFVLDRIESGDLYASTIGEQVKLARELSGLTQPDVCWRMGWASNSTLSRIESGAHSPNLETLDRLAHVLGACFTIASTKNGGVEMGLPVGLLTRLASVLGTTFVIAPVPMGGPMLRP